MSSVLNSVRNGRGGGGGGGGAEDEAYPQNELNSLL